MRVLAWLVFVALLGCAAPRPETVAVSPSPVSASPAVGGGAVPGTTPLGASPVVPPEDARPMGPLTRSMWSHWDGDILPWRAATYQLVFDVDNPLGLSPDEQKKAMDGLMRWKPAHGRYMFRMAELYELGKDRWPEGSEGHLGGARQAPEEFLIAQIDRTLPELRKQAAGARAEAKPYPEKLAKLKQADKIEMFPTIPSWEKTVPREQQLDIAPLGVVLPGLARDWQGEQAARAAAELEAMKVALDEQIEGWDTLHSVATAKPERVARIRERAEQLASGKVDMMAVYESAKPLARKMGIPEN